jgi:hydroxymethylpyrimidine/phosphomethylpyrimidine kinase
MPLYGNALDLIRANLEEISKGIKPQGVAIGFLTERQLKEINQARVARVPPLPPVVGEVLFYGRHMHKSRVVRDGYTVEDVIDQIVSAMDAAAEFVHTPNMTTVQNLTGRPDRYGNIVKDLAVFECSARHPRPELFSVMPKGDANKPPAKRPKR